jgi:hypothetical protein
VQSKHCPKHLQEFVVEIGVSNQHFNNTGLNVAAQNQDEVTSKSDEEPFNLLELKLLLNNAILSEFERRFGTEQRAVYLAAASLVTSDFTPAKGLLCQLNTPDEKLYSTRLYQLPRLF